MYSGTQLDFFEGIYDSFDGDFSEEDMYRVLGVSSSYRPKNSGSSNTESKPKKKTKEKSKSDSFDNDGFDKGFDNDGFDSDYRDIFFIHKILIQCICLVMNTVHQFIDVSNSLHFKH